MTSNNVNRLTRQHALESEITDFDGSVVLLDFVVQKAFADPYFETANYHQEALGAAVSILRRSWEELFHKMESATSVGTDDVLAVDRAVLLVEHVSFESFGTFFEERFPDESAAIHRSASGAIVSWRALAEAVAPRPTSEVEGTHQ